MYARFLVHYLLRMVEFDPDEFNIELALTAAADIHDFRLAYPELQVKTQIERTLGQRFTQSFCAPFENGAEAVVVIEKDIPNLNRPIIQSVFNALEEDIAIDPGLNGGLLLNRHPQKKQLSYSSKSIETVNGSSNKRND